MSRAKKLLEKARTAPRNLTFDDFCTLMRLHGFVLDHCTGSHFSYKHAGLRTTLIVQPARSGHAKPYQVKQFLTAIGDHV